MSAVQRLMTAVKSTVHQTKEEIKCFTASITGLTIRAILTVSGLL